jgi:hypothetical protein
MHHARGAHVRSRIAAVSVLCVCLAPLVAPCGAPETSFDERVRQHLVHAGYLSALDIIKPLDALDECAERFSELRNRDTSRFRSMPAHPHANQLFVLLQDRSRRSIIRGRGLSRSGVLMERCATAPA